MNYRNAALLEQLAGAYVVGVLRHRARRRFERLCRNEILAQAARQRWEDRLLPLALALPPVAPSRSCWAAIERSLAPEAMSSRPRWWQVAAAAAVVGALLLVGRLTIWAPPQWQPMAVLAKANAQPLWRLERSTDFAQISVVTVGSIALANDKDYELWILPAGGRNPVSLGLLPRSGQLHRQLSDAQRTLLAGAAQVAVSVEPSGGSPTGLPTGPVVIVAPISKAS
jgi:anti-sigma-K factor RskA